MAALLPLLLCSFWPDRRDFVLSIFAVSRRRQRQDSEIIPYHLMSFAWDGRGARRGGISSREKEFLLIEVVWLRLGWVKLSGEHFGCETKIAGVSRTTSCIPDSYSFKFLIDMNYIKCNIIT